MVWRRIGKVLGGLWTLQPTGMPNALLWARVGEWADSLVGSPGGAPTQSRCFSIQLLGERAENASLSTE